MFTKCWQRDSYYSRFSLTALLRRSDYVPADLPSSYARIEEYIHIYIYIRLINHFTSKLVTQSLLGNRLLKKAARHGAENSTDNLPFISDIIPATSAKTESMLTNGRNGVNDNI